MLLVFSNYISTPKERKLQEKLENVNYNLEAISLDLTNLTQEIDRIQERDANVHRVILGIDPMDETYWNSGIGGTKKYKSFMDLSSANNLIKRSLQKVDALKRKVELPK
ncbi:MAG: hypothetical protein R2771_03700 [Saprospiraceae bacterium]